MDIRAFGRVLTAGAVATLLAVAATPAFAQTQTGSMRGHVVDGKGQPVKDAEVVLDFVGDIILRKEGKTDKDGNWIIVAMPPGKYNIKVSKDGATAKQYGVQVMVNQMYRLRDDFVLRGAAMIDVPADLAGLAPASNDKEANEKAAEALQQMYKDGVKALNDGNFDEAISKFQDLVKVNDKCASCTSRLGEAYLRKGDDANAETILLKAIEIDPKMPEPYASLAGLYNSAGKLDDAGRMSEKAAELMANMPGGGDAGVVLNQGIIFWNQRRFVEAKLQFQRAVKIDPKFGEAHYWVGMSLVNEGKLAESKPFFEEYVKIEPNGEYIDTAKGILANIK